MVTERLRNFVLVMFLVSVPAFAVANTPWEDYLRAPTSSGAAAVKVAVYSMPDRGNRKFEADLPILEYEVAAGDAESVKLTARFISQFRNATAIAGFLDAIIGRSIRSNPVAYLEAIADSKGCPGARPGGNFFVDRDDARLAEAAARMRALKSVTSGAVAGKRDECLSILGRRW